MIENLMKNHIDPKADSVAIYKPITIIGRRRAGNLRKGFSGGAHQMAIADGHSGKKVRKTQKNC